MTARPAEIGERFVESIRARLAANERVRRSLPVWGRVHIDRQLPFLCAYRRPPGRDDPETDRFVVGEAAYLRAAGDRKLRPGLAALARAVVETLAAEFGAFLIVEVWAAEGKAGDAELPSVPSFRIFAPKGAPPRTVETLATALGKIRVAKRPASVEVVPAPAHPPGQPQLVPPREAAALRCTTLGVEIRPIWRDEENGQIFPLVRRVLSRRFGRALKQAVFEFTRERTTHRPPHYHSLGRRFIPKTGWEIDRQLAELSDSFDMLLLMTPVDSDRAYGQFVRSGCATAPVLHYRPLPTDPALLKRKLYDLRIERIEDPTGAALFRGKRRELDLRLTMLLERDTRRALFTSLLLYGKVGDELLALARRMIETIPPRSRESGGDGHLDGAAFAQRAQAEMDYYRKRRKDFDYPVQLREDFVGLMVSRGRLLVGKDVRIAPSRAEALLQHEVGTHVVTHYNGRAQPFHQLRCGLAGYDELQEGLAVFAEHIVGGLSRPRLRLLAARVLAAHLIVEGATFVETFRTLHEGHGFDRRTAWTVTLRIYRGGGLTKDAIYLRGLVGLLEYLGRGGELEPLFVGKIGAEHVPVVLELQRRGVLRPPVLRPRFMDHPDAAAKLERARAGLTVLDLIKES